MSDPREQLREDLEAVLEDSDAPDWATQDVLNDLSREASAARWE